MTLNHPAPNCDPVEADLSAFVDDTLDSARRAEVEAHLRVCAACAGLERDLRQIRTAAGSLGPLTPPAHVWLGVAGQVRPGDAADGSQRSQGSQDSQGEERTGPARTGTGAWQWLGIAAALVLTTLAIYVVTTRTPQTPDAAASVPARSNATTTAAVESVQDDLQRADALYASAIAKLEVIAKSDSSTLSPKVAAKLQHSLAAIDTAITESRSALSQHPESAPARDSLFEALRRKVGLLEETVALINVMRKGDQSGAAHIVGGKSSS